jgi:circadian clock protein KaiB
LSEIRLQLFVAGDSPRAERAIASLQQICEEILDDPCEVEVIDVTTHPERADEARILTTPTVVKRSPAPVRRIIGDLSDTEKVLSGLGLRGQPSSTSREP